MEQSAWHQPRPEHGKLTPWNWVAQHPEYLVLGSNTSIGSFTYINALHGVEVLDGAMIASHCSIYSWYDGGKQGKITVGRNVRIGSHTTIMPGVSIGDNTIVGAYSLVNKDLPANVIATGNPAAVVRTLREDERRNVPTIPTAPFSIHNSNSSQTLFMSRSLNSSSSSHSSPHSSLTPPRASKSAAATIPITKATLPAFELLAEQLRECFATNMITNHSHVRRLEEELQHYLGVKHVVAVSSCTSGMMLVMKVMELRGEVIVPSFTFSATGHAILWNALTPRFVEIDPETLTIDIQKVREAITPRTTAILAVHMFGCPAQVHELEEVAKEHNLKLIFDAAHALGSKVGSRMVGSFGDAEIFSCSPTKLLVTAEGGLVATNNDELARRVRVGRTYGDPGNLDCEFPGLSARMGEFNALLGLRSLQMLEQNIAHRHDLVRLYKEQLADIPGITFQRIDAPCRTTHKDFSLFIDSRTFGMNRDELATELQKRNIQTKKYFYPPLHLQQAYRQYRQEYDGKLPLTEQIAMQVLSLPLYSHMKEEEVLYIVKAVKEIGTKNGKQTYTGELRGNKQPVESNGEGYP